MCSDDETIPCVPTACQMTTMSLCCPSGYFWNSDLSCCSDTLICDPPCLSDEMCVSVSNVATCACNDSAYSGKTIADFSPSVSCNTVTMTISVSQCLLAHLGYDYTNMHLLNSSLAACRYSYSEIINNSSVRKVQLRVEDGWCGTIMTFDSTKLYYKNSLYIGIQNKSIITVSPMLLNFTCSYNLTMETSLIYALKPIQNTVTLPGPNGTGSYALTMAAYLNPNFISPIQADDTVEVGTLIYLGLFVANADGTAFSLRVEECYATPTNDPTDVNRVYIVRGGCAYTNDGVESVVKENGKSLEAQIQVSTFSFQGQLDVFIFCNATLCPKTQQCNMCTYNTRLARTSSTSFAQTAINIPLDYTSYLNSGSQTAVSWAVMLSFLVVLLKMNI
eukprot:XP_017946804.1 PREDICTED: thyroid hormone down-regulated protein (gene 18) isoform X1 [Xenopus tropicalis]